MKNKAIFLILFLLQPALTLGASETAQDELDLMLQSQDFSKGFNVAVIQPIHSLRDFRSSDIANIIPATELRETSDSSHVATRILGHSLTNFMNSSFIKNSEFGQKAQAMEKSMESQIEMGGESSDDIKHSIKFSMKAVQSRALIAYSGITNAQISYQMLESTVDVEVREALAMMKTDLVFNHVETREDRRDTLSLRWKW